MLSPFRVRHVVPRLAACLAGALALCSLAGVEAASAQLGDSTLRQGSRGKDVRELQALLRRAGFRARGDGVFGHGTWRAVRVLEREIGLRVDGVITPRDVRRIERALLPSKGTGGYSANAEEQARARQRSISEQTTPGSKAQLTSDGLAVPPADAPQVVKDVIEAGNKIATKPYRYGGGHGSWEDSGYDCSGSVSYALHGGDLLDSPMPSGSFTSWGDAGRGEWITIYANGGHMYMVVAGLRFDTSGRSGTGSRWQRTMRSSSGFTVRHPEGL